MEETIRFICFLTGCDVPTKQQKIPPKAFFITALKYFEEIEEGKTPMPKEIKDAANLLECKKQTMMKILMYEKGIQDLIQQGYIPVIDEKDNFWVQGWNCPVEDARILTDTDDEE